MTKFSRYNSGVMSIYREKARETNFGAKQNVTALANMDFVVKLAFERLSKRQQDEEFAMQSGFSLSEKVRTRKVNGVDSKCKAVINGYLYDIAYMDVGGGEIFYYLEGVRAL